MAKDPAMPFYVNDWLSSPRVQLMSLEQQGAYLRLLCFCWASQDASLPDDDKVLSRLSGMHEGWFANGSRLVRECFEPHPQKSGCLTNKRMLELWSERQDWRAKSAEGGRKSGETRRMRKTKGGSQMVRTKRQPNTNSSSSSSSSSSVVNPPTPKGGNKPVTTDDVTFPEGMDSTDVRSAVSEWLEHKRSLGKPYKSVSGVNRLLVNWLMSGPAAFVDAVHWSIGQNYQGLFSSGGGNGRVDQNTGQGNRVSPEKARQDASVAAIARFMSKGELREGDAGPHRIEADSGVDGRAG